MEYFSVQTLKRNVKKVSQRYTCVLFHVYSFVFLSGMMVTEEGLT